MQYEKYGPGKFEDNVQEYLYQLSLDGGGQEAGDQASSKGHATLLVLSPEDRQELGEAGHGYEAAAFVIVREDSQGFVTVETYQDEESAQAAFSKYQGDEAGDPPSESDPEAVPADEEDDLDNEDPPRDLEAEDDQASDIRADLDHVFQNLRSIHDQTLQAMELRKAGKIQDAVKFETAVELLIKTAKASGYGDAAETVQLLTHSGDDWKTIEADLNDANPPDPEEREESIKEDVAQSQEIIRKPYPHQAQCSTCGREGRVYTYGLDHGATTEWVPGKFCGKNCYFGYHGQGAVKGESMDPADSGAEDIGFVSFGGKDKSKPPISLDINPGSMTGSRPIHEIAREIRMKWPKPYFGAVPYLDAMLDLDGISDMYMHDSAESILLYFLANAQGFRGPDAKRLKEELKSLIASKKRGSTRRGSSGIPIGNDEYFRRNEAMEGSLTFTGKVHHDKKREKAPEIEEGKCVPKQKGKLKGKALAKFKSHKHQESLDSTSVVSRVRTALRLAAANVDPKIVMEQMFSGELSKREAESLFMVVQAGDKITIAGPDGNPIAGVAVRKTDDGNGWILDPSSGGAIASKETIVAVDNPVADISMGMDDFGGEDGGMGGSDPEFPDDPSFGGEEPMPPLGAGPAPVTIHGGP